MTSGLIWNNRYCTAHSGSSTHFCSLRLLRREDSSSWEAAGKAAGTSPADWGDIAATPQGQRWFFPGYATLTDYRENKDAPAWKCKLIPYLPTAFTHPKPAHSGKPLSPLPALWRSGWEQLLEQRYQIRDPELLHLESFTSTEYLWCGHWKAWNLYLVSPSTSISIRDMRNHFSSDNRLSSLSLKQK